MKLGKDRTPALQKLFEQMSEHQEELSRPRLILCFGTQFTNIGRPHRQSRKSVRNLPEPPYAVNALLSYFINNKVNLRKIFKDQVQSKRIRAG